MTPDLLAAAVKLDDAARFGMLAAFTETRNAAAAQGDAPLGEFLNELMIVLSDAQRIAIAEHRALDVDFDRVIGVVGRGPVDFNDEGGAA